MDGGKFRHRVEQPRAVADANHQMQRAMAKNLYEPVGKGGHDFFIRQVDQLSVVDIGFFLQLL